MQFTPQKINMEPGNDGETNRNLLFQGAPIFQVQNVCFSGCNVVEPVVMAGWWYWVHLPQMDVSKNRGTPKWMVKIMENP